MENYAINIMLLVLRRGIAKTVVVVMGQGSVDAKRVSGVGNAKSRKATAALQNAAGGDVALSMVLN